MVKVVDRPIPKFYIDCKHCGKFLEYTKEDAISSWDDVHIWIQYIWCPNCGKRVIINTGYER